MFGCRILLIAAVVICGFPAEALPVHVTFGWPAGTPISTLSSVHIEAVRTAGSSNNGAALESEADGTPEGALLNLAEGVWQVEASAPGYWSQGAEVVVARQEPVDVRLTFWPAASLRGEIITVGGEPLPRVIEVQLNATTVSPNEQNRQPSAQQTDHGPSRAKLHCPINAGTWSCLGPAGLFDVRLEASGYAPRYEWGVSLSGTQNIDFGRTELLRTASVFGRVLSDDGSNPRGPCRATLHPDLERHGPAESDQEPHGDLDGKTRFSVSPNKSGYFQIVGITPGRYALAVGCQGASAFRELRVQTDSETRLDPPLTLEDLTLDISVTPKTNPAGQQWRLAVYETAPHYLTVTNGATTSADGRWTRRGLMAGNYRVTLRSSDGTAWLQKYFDLSKSSGPLSLRTGSVSVAGRVMMSSQPVRARIVFTNDVGGESATLISDNNGRFQGLLPVGQAAQNSIWTVEANIVQPPVTQRLLGISVRQNTGGATWLDLDLPTIPVSGSVVSPDGKPQTDAEVTFEDSKGLKTTTGTDNAGRFEMLDLAPGKYTAVADSHDGTSDRTPFDVTEGSGSELKLVLNPFKLYSFFVVSNQGPVADAAVQVWISPGVPRAFVRTDDNGRFEVSLPPGTTEMGLTIGAQGYALKLTRLRIPNDSSDDSQDARTINLDTSAGTLVLNFQPPGRMLDNSASLYLVHDGAIQDARTIVGWGTDRAGANTNRPATVDMIEPGDYALCRITDPSQLAAIWSRALPPGRCSKGSLDEDETLILSPH